MAIYEYQVLASPWGLLPMKEKRINAEAAEGWRLITVIGDGEGIFFFYFERPKPAREEEAAVEQPHPVQPLIKNKDGVTRFKANAIVRHLLDFGPDDMNRLGCMRFSREDRVQFAQLIGYTLSGFGELGYVTDEDYERAEGTT